MLEQLDKVPQVIFTTAYDEFALKAFDVNALDYLVKPIQEDRLAEALKKVNFEEGSTSDKILGKDDQVFVKDGDKCWFVKLDNVRYFESDGNYIKVFFDGFRPMIHKSLNAFDELLDDRHFFRASRKHIINLGWVEKIDTWRRLWSGSTTIIFSISGTLPKRERFQPPPKNCTSPGRPSPPRSRH